MTLKNNRKLLIIGFLALALAILSWSIFKVVLKGDRKAPEGADTQPQVLIPTKTPQEREIISKVKDWQVEVSGNRVLPASLTIKPNDQVQIFNRSQEEITIKGESGERKVRPGFNIMEILTAPGEYSYSILGVGKPLSLTIVVK